MNEWTERAEDAREAFVGAVATGAWRGAQLDPADAALLAFAEKLTRTPGGMTAADVEALRSAGFDDVQVHDAVQVTAYFNYINRVADAVDVELEPEYPPHPRHARGEERG